jgi:hypothetical protein
MSAPHRGGSGRGSRSLNGLRQPLAFLQEHLPSGKVQLGARMGDLHTGSGLLRFLRGTPPRGQGDVCAGYGFHPGTHAFAACLQRVSLARRALTCYPVPPYWGYWDIGYGGSRTGVSERL